MRHVYGVNFGINYNQGSLLELAVGTVIRLEPFHAAFRRPIHVL